MDSSCIEDTSTTSDSDTTKLSPLHRMGSNGSSVVLDTDNGVETESSSARKLPSSKYKGVVPQPNGRWGAQIYEKHQRVWLGTFNEEQEAATSYDIAARRFRGRDAVTNFKETIQNDAESVFLDAHSKAEIVDMLRKHTYDDEFQQSKRRIIINNGKLTEERNDVVLVRAREVLFEKAVTPSDVGKLNRLVIPKQHAERHFPLPLVKETVTASKGVLINLEDRTGKVWRFRYSYWNSSQSYVLTKGWSRFVKEKGLKAGDLVCFERSTGLDRQLFIDWKIRSGTPVQNVVRLFGVNIYNVSDGKRDDVVEECGGGGKKRARGSDLFALRCSKKQAIINAL